MENSTDKDKLTSIPISSWNESRVKIVLKLFASLLAKYHLIIFHIVTNNKIRTVSAKLNATKPRNLLITSTDHLRFESIGMHEYSVPLTVFLKPDPGMQALKSFVVQDLVFDRGQMLCGLGEGIRDNDDEMFFLITNAVYREIEAKKRRLSRFTRSSNSEVLAPRIGERGDLIMKIRALASKMLTKKSPAPKQTVKAKALKELLLIEIIHRD